MNIVEATKEVGMLDDRKRSQYSFHALARYVARRETGESFVTADELIDAGCTLAPFWETLGDTEGDCYQSYIAKHPAFELHVRRGVLDCLRRAIALLPDHWQLVLKAGFRPYDVQIAVLEAFVHESRARHPYWNDDKHLEQARTFVADPRIVCPPHTTGGAVDVVVKNRETGSYVDMGCPPNTDSEISFLFSDLLTKEQQENRMILLDAMLAAGFAPNPHEWWHYQYGETYWAAFYGRTQTLYDIVTS